MQRSTPPAPPKLTVAVQEFLRRRRSEEPVSIADIRGRVRYAMPEVVESDDVLGEMIATEIIKNGGNVRFDGRCVPSER